MTALENARALIAQDDERLDRLRQAGFRIEGIFGPRHTALRALADEHERLTAPPTDAPTKTDPELERQDDAPTDVAEREALADVVDDALTSLTDTRDACYRVADAILASDVWRNRRQGPVTNTQVEALATIRSSWSVIRGAQMDMLNGRPDMDAMEEIALASSQIDAALEAAQATNHANRTQGNER